MARRTDQAVIPGLAEKLVVPAQSQNRVGVRRTGQDVTACRAGEIGLLHCHGGAIQQHHAPVVFALQGGELPGGQHLTRQQCREQCPFIARRICWVQ